MRRDKKACCEWAARADEGATGCTFEIRTIADFLLVPEERRRVCLREFDAWLALQVSVPALLEAAAIALGTPIPAGAIQMREPDVFRWVDDGKATMSVTFHGRDSEDAIDSGR